MEDVAVEISKEVLKGINSYYDSLSVLGYRPQSDINSLLIYSFLEEIITGPMRIYITEEDYRTISKAMNCLQGTCLIPFKQYQGNEVFGNFEVTAPRITEDSNIRTTEDSIIRYES